MSVNTLGDTSFLNLPVYIKGKVRDVYDLGDKLLIVVTDRISAFDVVFPNLIPNKGKVLNSISEFWFEYTKDVIGNHMITTDVSRYPGDLPRYREQLQDRSMLVKKVQMLEAECIIRGYLTGSALKEYNKSKSICGVKLPDGLVESSRLPEPIFTPTTKAKEGHDENISVQQLADLIGSELANKIKDIGIALYEKVSRYTESKGIILADTKFEFGLLDSKLVIADEIFTPDSSRFWDKSEYVEGRPQKSFDKQFLRDYLEGIKWDKTPPAPQLPEDVVRNTELKYLEAYKRLVGKDLE